MRAHVLRVALLALLAVFIGCQTTATGGNSSATKQSDLATEGKLPRGWLAFESGLKLTIEFASTPDEIRTGLSYREGLCEGCGLYFVFPDEDIRTFWMRQMRFPIDIIWINRGKVVGVVHDAQPQPGVPESELRTWESPVPARNVLEVPAGFARRHGIAEGTSLKVWIDP